MIAHTLAQQDEDATKVNEAEVVERVALVADHEAAEVPQPGEESLNLPAVLVATERTTILVTCSLEYVQG